VNIRRFASYSQPSIHNSSPLVRLEPTVVAMFKLINLAAIVFRNSDRFLVFLLTSKGVRVSRNVFALNKSEDSSRGI
jgi:hypothetical protein